MPLSLDFAFEGFRLIREKPKLVLFWGLVLLIGNGIGQLLLVAIGGPALEQAQGLTATTDPAIALPIAERLLAAFAAVAPVGVITSAIVSCAVFRATWNAGEGGKDSDRFGYLRFGGDEIRQIVVIILYVLLALLLMLAVSTVAGVLASLAGGGGPAIEMVASAITVAVVFAFMLRLSLCGAQSFDRKTIDLFGSWKLTARHGWTLIGGYLVAAVMVLFVMILCFGIFGALAMVAYSGQLAVLNQVTHPDVTSLQAYLKPLAVVFLVVRHFLVGPLIAALLWGAQATAYRVLSGQTPDPGI